MSKKNAWASRARLAGSLVTMLLDEASKRPVVQEAEAQAKRVRRNLGFKTPLRRDAAAVVVGVAAATGAIAAGAPAGALVGAAFVLAGASDAFDRDFGVRKG